MSHKASVAKALPAGVRAVGVSTNHLADQLGISSSTARKVIGELVAEGRAVRVDDNTRTPLYKAKAATTPAPDTAGGNRRALAVKDGRNGGGRKTRKVEPAAPVDDRGPDAPVWAPTLRKGIGYHQLDDAPSSTLCDRSTLSATSWRGSLADAVAAGMTACQRCAVKAAERAATATDTPVAPTGTATVSEAAPGSLEDLIATMETVRPVSAPPAKAPRVPSPKRVKGQSKPTAPEDARTFGLGELRDAVITYVRKLPKGKDASAWEIAAGIKAPHAQPVLTNLKRQIDKGTLVATQTTPRLRVRAA
jgi:hypothetical protein